MIVIEGAGQLAAVSAELDAAAAELPRDMTQGVVKAMQPLTRAIPAAASALLPHSGGLAGKVAASSIRIAPRGNGASLQISSPYNIRQIDGGSVTHPTYGHGPLVTQPVPAGFVSKPAKAAEPHIRDAVDKSLQAAADKVG